MSYTLFIIAVTCYLVSMVAGLVSALFVRKIPVTVIRVLIVVHFFLLVLFIMLSQVNDSAMPAASGYLFLLFICSGIVIAGLLLRSTMPLYSKVYFSLFLFSLIAFIASPSRLLNFIVSGSLNGPKVGRFHIGENYYLVEQNQMAVSDAALKTYKLTKEMGMFHKTILRDISVPEHTDSIVLVNRDSNTMKLRFFYPANAERDSMDLTFDLAAEPTNSNELRQIRK